MALLDGYDLHIQVMDGGPCRYTSNSLAEPLKNKISMNFPTLTHAQRIDRLAPPSDKVRVVLDTDTYNEVDDQFAVAHALLSP